MPSEMWQLISSPPPSLELKVGFGCTTSRKIWKFYIAVGEFYSISEAINAVSGHGHCRTIMTLLFSLSHSLSLPPGPKREFRASSLIKTMLKTITLT